MWIVDQLILKLSREHKIDCPAPFARRVIYYEVHFLLINGDTIFRLGTNPGTQPHLFLYYCRVLNQQGICGDKLLLQCDTVVGCWLLDRG